MSGLHGIFRQNQELCNRDLKQPLLQMAPEFKSTKTKILEKYNLIAKTFSGLEPVLASEIKNIGGQNISQGRRAVFFEGDKKLIYKSNYYLRTALRIMKEIDSFQFKDVDQFYLKCKKINWKKLLNINQS